MPAIGDAGVQLETPVGPLLLLPQVVVVQLLPAFAEDGVHAATPVGPVGIVMQLVVV